jgi:tellurite resistance protein TerC
MLWYELTHGEIGMFRRTLAVTYRKARRIVIAVIGGTVLLVGVALIFLPGPAFLVIPAGLAILSIEFAWARRWLKAIKDRLKRSDKRTK